ncbi:MAG TPA: alpha/beta hydrolase [Ktedonobacteraceae bacterium]|nr:alpha/beta hydrolase [Ktedonobacteraceae bacterium]
MNSRGSEGKHTPLRFAYGAESLQFGDLYLPQGSGPHPVVILIHGGFWRAAYGLSLMQGLAEDLVQNNIAAWNIEYRRVGDAGGGWPGTLEDVACAADHLVRLAPAYALDLTRVVPVGHSAGGQLALWLAARSRLPKTGQLAVNEPPLSLVGAVSLAGASDLRLVWHLNLGHGAARDFLGGSPDKVPARYAIASPAALLPLGIPQVLIHGKKDDIVPLTVSQQYAQQAALVGDRVTLIELPGADHFTLIDRASTAWRRTVVEIQQLQYGA